MTRRRMMTTRANDDEEEEGDDEEDDDDDEEKEERASPLQVSWMIMIPTMTTPTCVCLELLTRWIA